MSTHKTIKIPSDAHDILKSLPAKYRIGEWVSEAIKEKKEREDFGGNPVMQRGYDGAAMQTKANGLWNPSAE